MIDTPRITQTAAQLTASLHLVVPRPDIQNVMGPGLSEVRAAIAAHDIVAAGARRDSAERTSVWRDGVVCKVKALFAAACRS